MFRSFSILLAFICLVPFSKKKTRVIFLGDSLTELASRPGGFVRQLDSIALLQNEKDYQFIGSGVSGNKIYDLFLRLEDDVLNGRGLTTALSETAFVPGAAAEMMMTAEKTGSLGPVSVMVGQHFEEEGEAKLKELVSVAEPLITVVMGLVVAVIVMSVMLPLFDLSSAAGKGH